MCRDYSSRKKFLNDARAIFWFLEYGSMATLFELDQPAAGKPVCHDRRVPGTDHSVIGTTQEKHPVLYLGKTTPRSGPAVDGGHLLLDHFD
jgi:hypothetical protein